MVLARSKSKNVMAVDHSNKACFLANQKLLNNNTAARRAKFIASKHVFNGSVGLLKGFGNNHPFTCGKAIGFNDNWQLTCTNIGFSWFNVSKVCVVGGRNIVASKKVFAKSL